MSWKVGWVICATPAWVCQMMMAAISSPTKAPAVSPARWRPKASAALFFVHAAGHERVARGGADALAHAVGEAHAQHPLPSGGEIQEGLGDGREPVAEHGQALAFANAVRDHA
jgi:hypothetical protein